MSTLGETWTKAKAIRPRPEHMRLRANRQSNERAYTKTIRQWLEANAGRPRVARRAVVDLDGVPSLR